MKFPCCFSDTRVSRRFLTLFRHSDLHGTRFLLGLAEFGWAIALLWPGSTFGRPTYHGMQALMSEDVWGALFLLTGFIQWRLLFTCEYHSKRAIVFAAYNSALWLFCVLSMYLSVYPPPAAISGETALCLGACWIFVRSGEYKHERRSAEPVQDYGVGNGNS